MNPGEQPTAPSPDASRPIGMAVPLAAALALVVVVTAHLWLVSGGTWVRWPTQGAYYQRLADAFGHGQTHLIDPPDARLLALPDPYDPAQNAPYRLHDASLYERRYYLYWGPVPALLTAAVNVVVPGSQVSDNVLTFAFTSGAVAFAAALLAYLRRRHFPDAPAWTLPLSIAVIGLATPWPFNLARAKVYEASIAAGQMFFLAGLYCAVRALDRNRPSRARLLLAGVCLACAAGSRVSTVFALTGAALAIAYRIWRTRDPRSPGADPQALASIVLLGLPLLSGAVGLAAYNQARFGSPFEVGIRYQLANFNSHEGFGQLTSPGNVVPNLRAYLVEPVPLRDLLPFGRSVPRGGGAVLWGVIALPGYAPARETPAGMLWVVPFVLFAIATARRSGFPADTAGAFARWTTLLLASCVLLLAIPALLLAAPWAGLRYQGDWTTPMLILSTLGFWLGCRRLARRPIARGMWLAAGMLLALSTMAAGILLAITRTPAHFIH